VSKHLHLESTTDSQSFESNYSEIALALHKQGYIVQTFPLPPHLPEALLLALKQHYFDELAPAGIGREDQYQHNPFVRSDRIYWIDQHCHATKEYLSWVDGLRRFLNRELFLGLRQFECHYAHYAPGDYYKRHVDAFKGEQNRKITIILYLNPGWQCELGGELIVYDGDSQNPLIKISPTFGKMVVFISDEFPHEVLAAKVNRYSLTGWLRQDGT